MSSLPLLFEIGTEEIPARYLDGLREQLHARSVKLFEQARIDIAGLKAYATPRRLVLSAEKVSDHQKEATVIIQGPSVKVGLLPGGGYTPAALGFAKKIGIGEKDLIVKDTEKGEYIFGKRTEKAVQTVHILPDIFKELMCSFSLPKSMKWDDSGFQFVRPVRWITALYGGKVIRFDMGRLRSAGSTFGHPMLNPGRIPLKNPKRYVDFMANNYIILDHEKRRDMITSQIKNIAKKIKGTVMLDPEIMEDVIYMLEYPTAVLGGYNSRYLSLPRIVLITCLKHYQKFFSVFAADGELLPYFVGIRDGISEYLDNVKEGYERVLAARLADAEFFYRQDTRIRLEDFCDKLKGVVFQEKLGSMHDKARRVCEICGFIASLLSCQASQTSIIKRAAMLCKADLVTSMVGEFPELEGEMGAEYASRSGEDPSVVSAIREHKMILTPEYRGGLSLEGCIVSLADKMDTIIADFSVGLIPTGSEDPYGLRRQAYTAVKIMIEHNMALSIRDIAEKGFDLLPVFSGRREKEDVVSDVIRFFDLRIRSVLDEKSILYDEINAVLCSGNTDPHDVHERACSVHKIRSLPDFDPISTSFKRAKNIVDQAGAKGIFDGTVEFDEKKLVQTEEKILWEAYEKVRKDLEPDMEKKDYMEALRKMVGLRSPLDVFFDKVLVMDRDEGVRLNRLALLDKILRLFYAIGDFSKIVSGKEE